MRQEQYKRLGNYIQTVDVRNKDLKVTRLLGVSVNKEFMPSIANTIGTDMSGYKIVRSGQFVYVEDTSRRGDKIALALLTDEEEAIVSSIYTVFEVSDTEHLLPEYLMMWFRRPEFDRYARFHSHGSAREIFDWEEMCNVMLPVPPIARQREIVEQYATLTRRIRLNEQTIDRLEAAAQALYRKMFVTGIDPNQLPEGWRMGTLEDVTKMIIAGTIPVYDNASEHKVLGQKCNHNHRIDLALTKTHIPKKNITFLKEGDILINSTGAGTLGRVAQILVIKEELSFDSNMTMVRPINDLFVDYLGLFLQNKEDYFVQISQGSTNQTRLYCSMVRPIEIIIPSIGTLKLFKKRIHSVRIDIENRYREITLLTTLQRLLLTRMTQS